MGSSPLPLNIAVATNPETSIEQRLTQELIMGFACSNAGLEPHLAAETAVSVIGLGFDICKDIRFSPCKKGPSGSSLIAFDSGQTRDLVFPGGVVVPNVPTSIRCDKGERTRFRSDVLRFNQVIVNFCISC